MARPELSLVIPIYNEEEVLPQLDERVRALLERLGMACEVVFVDDGSKDRSLELLRGMAAKEPRYKVASFSRNFGHQRAITAGMDLTRGKAVVVMDADLQDPPEVILDMVAKWREGYDVVYGRRRSRAGETWFKLFTAKIFYRAFAAMIPIEVPLDAGDFRLMSRRVVLTLKSLRESHRFIRGLVSWIGFKQTAVEYDRHARAAGETKYPLKKMLAFAADGIASFSVMPLRMATYLGVFVGLGSLLYALVAVITWALGHTIPGWTTTVLLVSFLFSVQFLMMGVLGEYVGRIYEQLKLRPLYIVAEKINFERKATSKKKRADSSETAGTEAPNAAEPLPPARDRQRSLPPPLPPSAFVTEVPDSAPPPPLALAPPRVPNVASPRAPSVKPPPVAVVEASPPSSKAPVTPSKAPPAPTPSKAPPAPTPSKAPPAPTPSKAPPAPTPSRAPAASSKAPPKLPSASKDAK